MMIDDDGVGISIGNPQIGGRCGPASLGLRWRLSGK